MTLDPVVLGILVSVASAVIGAAIGYGQGKAKLAALETEMSKLAESMTRTSTALTSVTSEIRVIAEQMRSTADDVRRVEQDLRDAVNTLMRHETRLSLIEGRR